MNLNKFSDGFALEISFLLLFVIAIYFYFKSNIKPFMTDVYPMQIEDVKHRNKEQSEPSEYIYNNSQTARMRQSNYKVIELKRGLALTNYLFWYDVAIMILIFIMFFFLYKILLCIRAANPLETKIDQWLRSIGYLLMLLGALSYGYHYFVNNQIQNIGFGDYKVYEKNGSYFLFGVLAFAFARIMKKAKEYKAENDLTV